MSLQDNPTFKFVLNTLLFSYVLAFIVSFIINGLKSFLVGDIGKLKFFGKFYYYIIGVDITKGSLLQLFLIIFFTYYVWQTISIMRTEEEEAEEVVIKGKDAMNISHIVRELGIMFDWLKKSISIKSTGIFLLIIGIMEIVWWNDWKINPFLIFKSDVAGILAMIIFITILYNYFSKGNWIAMIMGNLGIAVVIFLVYKVAPGLILGVFGEIKTQVIGAIKTTISVVLDFVFGISSMKPTILSFETSEVLYKKLWFEELGIYVRIILGLLIWLMSGWISKKLEPLTDLMKLGYEKASSKITILPKIKKVIKAEDVLLTYDKESKYTNDIMTILSLLKMGDVNQDQLIVSLITNIANHTQSAPKEKLKKAITERFGESTTLEKGILLLIKEALKDAEKKKKK